MFKLALVGLLLPFMVAPSAAQSTKDVEGVWVADGGYATFTARLCGDGNQVCATLDALSNDTVAPILEPFVGQEVITNAQSISGTMWQVNPVFGSDTAKGIITLIEAKRIEAIGCLLDDCRRIYFNKVPGDRVSGEDRKPRSK